jgi:hypothetical protein
MYTNDRGRDNDHMCLRGESDMKTTRRVVGFLAASLMLMFLLGSGVVRAQQNVSFFVDYLPLDQLRIADLDFQTGGSSSYYFTLSVQGDPCQACVALKFQLSVLLPDVSYPNALDFTTETFDLPRTYTNLDIGPNSPIKLKRGTKVNWTPQEAKTRIETEALATGKLPAGTYRFVVTLVDADGHQLPNVGGRGNPQTIELTLRNISRLDLISPLNNEVVPNPFPLFQWVFDGTRVELSVYERLPQHQSKEEAAQGVPQLIQALDGVSSFQYPPTASRLLEAGKRYVWRVQGSTSGSGGVGTTINSEIWEFSVAGSGGSNSPLGGGGSQGQQNIVNQLQNIPGMTTQLMDQLNSGNLQPTGVLMVNGLPVSAGELVAVLNDLAQNPDKVIEIQIIDR